MSVGRRRIEGLLDAGSFRELPDDFPFRSIPRLDPAPRGDGVVAGLGTVDGRPVAVYAQEPEVYGGSVGLGEARRICALLDAAAARACPVVGLIHSGGARIQEGVDSLAGYGEIFERNVRLSGEVPQISVVLGPCAGGAVYSPALTDFVAMVRGKGEMFVTGPDVIRRSTGEVTDRASLGGSAVHLEKSGVAHFGVDSEEDSFRLVRRLLSYLPSSRHEPPPKAAGDDPDRLVPELDAWAAGDRRRSFDVREMLARIVDAGSLLEVQRERAPNVAAAFARLGGEAVGVVANNSAFRAGALDIDGSEKAARFVRFCGEFGLPLVTFVDVPGYWPGVEQEHGGLIRRGAKLLYAYAEASVPRLAVVLHKAYGGAYDVMSSKHLGADWYAAWPTAELAVMGPAGAVEILHRAEIAAAADPDAARRARTAEYEAAHVNPKRGLERGYVDEIIAPSATRRALCARLKECLARGFLRGPRRGNIPL